VALPLPQSPATAQRTVRELCYAFFAIIEKKSQSYPPAVTKIFKDMAYTLTATHPEFDVGTDSDQSYSCLTFRDDGGEPEDLDHVDINPGNPSFYGRITC